MSSLYLQWITVSFLLLHAHLLPFNGLCSITLAKIATLTFFTVKIKTRWGIRWQGESKDYCFCAPKMQTCNKIKSKPNSTVILFLNFFFDRFLSILLSLSLSIFFSIYFQKNYWNQQIAAIEFFFFYSSFYFFNSLSKYIKSH